jgi:plastocyanin
MTLLAVSLATVVVGWSGWLSPRFTLRLETHDVTSTAFIFQPDPIVAPATTAVSLMFVNASTAPHTLVLLAPIDSGTTGPLDPGQSQRLDFTTPSAGTYRFVCTVHEGMTGTLLVE